ncbi:MAG: hypothetical protein IRZ02_05260 [Acidothermus sp.]|nr:hypothetical protein [Acidothermus sp.]
MANLQPVPTNNVTGSGSITVTLTGNTITVHETVSGLLDGVPHAQHIHIKDSGAAACPTQADAKDHNGHLSINTTDGMAKYGMPQISLTTSGDTSSNSALAVDRMPTGASFTYDRTITISADEAQAIRDGRAAVVVHGIDYNGNGKWDDVLGPSDLDPKLPAEATDPALCGVLVASQMNTVPSGGAATGGGSTAGLEDVGLIGLGAALVVAGGLGLGFATRRRHVTE